MKKVFFSVAALVAAMSFTACSSEDGLDQAAVWNEDGTGYMAFNISMPQISGDRANDNYNEGTPEEYKVYNAALFIFEGDNEATATFHSAYDLTNDGSWGTASPGTNITVDKKYVAKIEGTPDISKMKAFVVLNNNGIFTVDNTTHTLSINGENFPVGHPFSELQAKTSGDKTLNLNATKFTGNGILMMNSPLFSAAGETMNPSAGQLRLLAPVYADNIYKTENEAKEGQAATSVYVERAVAKVSVKKVENVETPDNFSAVLDGWTLDNTNRDSYLVRSIANFNDWTAYKANNKYRMVGNKDVHHDAAISAGTQGHSGYRTYFAKDVNYDVDVVLSGDDATFNSVSDFTTLTSLESSQYCAENTFDVKHMDYKNTTRVIVKATITPTNEDNKIGDGNNFYSKPGDDKFYSEVQMQTLLQNHVNSQLAGLKSAGKVTGDGAVFYTVTTKENHKDFVVKAIGEINYPADQASLDEALRLTAEEKALVDGIKSDDGKEFSIHTIGYDYYEGGVSYYEARIQHFGDDHTPWTPKDASTVEEAYGADYNAEAYLGRWGVLRNNWYELTVGSVKKIGYAHPENISFDPTKNPDPEYPNTPDDNQKSEQWIAVDVNILAWAVRNQNLNF